MNTRSSMRGRSYSSSRDNTSGEQGAIPKIGSRVVHSPLGVDHSDQGRMAHSLNSSNRPATESKQNNDSSDNLAADLLSSDLMDNPNLSANAQVFVPLSGRTSDLGVQNETGDRACNLPILSERNLNTNHSVGFDILISMMEESMRNTRAEFRQELSSLRESISQIGASTRSNSNRAQDVPDRDLNLNQSATHQRNVNMNTDNNVKLEKWKVSFGGNGSVTDFLFKVETLSNRARCSEEHLLSNFHVLLEGKAEDWYWRFIKQNRNISYARLHSALTKEFGHHESDHDILLRMSSRKQHFKESYDDFHSSIISMNQRLQSPLPDVTLIDIIQKNLHPGLRFLLFSADARDINNFRDLARKAEKVIRDSKNPNFSAFSKNVSEIEAQISDESKSDPNDPQIEALSYAPRRQRFDYSGIECWNCNLYGHSYVYCSQEITRPFCFKCGNKGVLTPNCPNTHNQGNRKMDEMVSGGIRPSHKPPSLN